jgi:hypothetical protein
MAPGLIGGKTLGEVGVIGGITGLAGMGLMRGANTLLTGAGVGEDADPTRLLIPAIALS